MIRFGISAVLATCVGLLTMTVAVASAAERPNVILMMADDLGYGDLSCYGSDLLRTPQLDKMANEGIRLTSFYAGATVCTPSRMALLTGSYPTRLGWPGGVIGYKIPWKSGLATEAVTIGEVFKDAGYATAMCGKWHLGDGDGMQPMKQGFDTAFYIKSSNNQTKKSWRGDELVADPFDNRRLSEQFTNAAIDFIKAHKSVPFFLYLPFTAPHFPAQAHPDFKGKSNNAAYGDVVEELDSRIGEILAVLKQEKIDQRTMVVFLSDNGPEPGQRKWASGKPFRGLKWSSLEGGTRVPCIIRWPGVIPAERESDALIAAIDLLPTIAHACGIDLPPEADRVVPIDGVSVWETLVDQGDTADARESLLFWNGWAELEAIRVGEWKVYVREVKGVAGSAEGPVLVHLATDSTESKNLAQQHPDKVAAMKKLAASLVADIESRSLPLGDATSSN